MPEFTPSDGSRLTRNDKVALDESVIKAAQESLSNADSKGNGSILNAEYASEKEAKRVVAKLRSYLNEKGQGLRAAVVANADGTATLEFRVTATKRDVSPKSQS